MKKIFLGCFVLAILPCFAGRKILYSDSSVLSTKDIALGQASEEIQKAAGFFVNPKEVFSPAASRMKNKPNTLFRKYFEPTRKLPIDIPGMEFLTGCTVSSDYYMVRNARTLTSDSKDVVDQFRQRTDFTFFTRQGVARYTRQSVLDAQVTFGNTLFWRTFFNNDDYGRKGYTVPVNTPQDRIHSPFQIHLQEAWLRVNFDQIAKGFEGHPHSLKLGVFPYYVGRGISLGDWYQGGNYNMGFGRTGIQQYAPMYPPGILWSGHIMPRLDYEVYFSPLPMEEVTTASIDSTEYLIMNKEKNNNARHVFSLRTRSSFSPTGNSKIYFEPYFVYYNSPRQTRNVPCDIPTRFGTFGFMWDHKVGGFQFNVEAAIQHGRQNILRSVYRGAPYINDSGTINPGGESANSSGYYAHGEVHDDYYLKLRGKMAVLDFKYKLKNYPVQIAGAAGYFSGDSYPYNDRTDQYLVGDVTWSEGWKKDREYKGFLPVRDYHYVGLWSTPLVMFSAGIVPRPLNMALFDITAYNDEDSATNLKYLGGGASWSPLKDAKKLNLRGNMFWYWEDVAPKRWNHKAWTHASGYPDTASAGSGTNSVIDAVSSMSSTYRAELEQWEIEGWTSDDYASKFLGWEVNAVATYKIFANCEFSLRGGVFFPGQLYSDIKGQPNTNTDVFDKAYALDGSVSDDLKAPGLGSSTAYGMYARIRYIF
ncbi:hypothetical protein KAU11_04395 [Candidatus Babeliales bacterium]|nr:hypothetical protein [Candidatus Babeliales bacterium]